MHYIIEYDIAAIVVSLAVLFSFFRKKTINTKLTGAFLLLIVMILVSSIFDLITIYTIENSQKVPLVLNYICNILYFVSFNGVSPAFYNCMRYAPNGKETLTRRKIELLMVPWILDVLFIATSPFTGLIFYFDADKVYHHGVAFIGLYIFAAFYVFLAFLRIALEREDTTATQRFTVYFFAIACVIAMVFQALIPELMLVCFIESVSTTIAYLALVNPSIYIDKDMNTFNHDAFECVFQRYLTVKKSVRVIGLQVIGLKYLNDTIGLENKNRLLKELSQGLKLACGKYGIYRLSSSRLFIIIPDDEKIQNRLIERIHLVFEQPVRIDDVKISLSDRIATLRFPEDADTVDDVIQLLYENLNSIIDAGPGTVVAVDKEKLSKKHREMQILQIMKTAIRRGDFYVVYQPIYSFELGRFSTAEALIRLDNDILGEIKPEEFIPIAEKNGMILQIGEYVFETVCRFILHQKIWEKGLEYIHINLSVIQCMQENLAEQLLSIMNMYNLDYHYINLEITETAAVASSEILLDNMKTLSDNNMDFSLDDFGSGFSNTSSLIKYPFNTIKLDKTMVWEAMHNEKAEKILRNTIEMVKQLKMEIVAEGAETPEQVDTLREMGCDYVQGFYYSKPLSRADFIKLLNDNKGRW